MCSKPKKQNELFLRLKKFVYLFLKYFRLYAKKTSEIKATLSPLLLLLALHISRKEKIKWILHCCLGKELLFTGGHFKMFLLLFKVVKMTLLKPTILFDLNIEPFQTLLESSLQATVAPCTIIINTTQTIYWVHTRCQELLGNLYMLSHLILSITSQSYYIYFTGK